MFTRFLLPALLVLTLPSPSIAAPSSVMDQAMTCTKTCPYFFDAYKKDAAFRNQLLNAMKASGIRKPDWMPNGVAGPFAKINIEGAAFLSTSICEPHNCGNNQIFILFDPRSRLVKGLYVEDMRRKTYFGNPGNAEKKALDELAR